MLFQAVMKFLSRLVEFKILVNWGMVHWGANIHIFVFTDHKNNRFQKELIMQNTKI